MAALVMRALGWLHMHVGWLAVRRGYTTRPPEGTFEVVLDPQGGDTIELWFIEKEEPIDQFSRATLLIAVNDTVLFAFGQKQAAIKAYGETGLSLVKGKLAPRWVARVQVDMHPRAGNLHGDLLSCVGVAKRLMGIYEPRVQSTEQLLAYLWENRHGNGSGHDRGHRLRRDYCGG